MLFEELRGLFDCPVTVSCSNLGYLVSNDDADTLIDAYGQREVVGISVCMENENGMNPSCEFDLTGNILVRLV